MISFGQCVCGYAPEPPVRSGQAWAALAGFGDCVTFVDADHPAGFAAAPAPAACVAVRLRYPYVAARGAPFWCAFDPVGALQNGYDDHPDDLLGFRLVKARIVTEPDTGPSRRDAMAWAEILDVLEPSTLLSWRPNLEPVSTMAGSLRYRPCRARSGALFYRSSNVEGDVVTWSLAYRDETRASLLVFGESGRHENRFFAGHRPLSPEEFEAFS